ncbi:MAG TPA: fumarylacetoacetate hydrolase family protein [Candidatus Thermoplasmatota archaeon]|nr:fumarylacetoacetate hydrolase family protein [Candidatus Thermoplasmatota archaeon]
MRLCTFDAGEGPRAGAVRGQGTILDLNKADPSIPSDLNAVLAGGEAMMEKVRQFEASCSMPSVLRKLAEVRLLPPVRPTRYLDFYSFEQHVKTARAKRNLEVVPEWYDHPTYYNGNPYSMVGPDGEVRFPPGETQRDYELELAVVIGKPIRDATPEQAVDAIAGFTCLNDWSARRIQMAYAKIGMGPSAGKDFATGLGPWIVTRDEVPDVGAIEMVATVNGEEWSRGLMRDARYDWGQMLAFATRGAELRPGDVVGSGTFGGGCGYELDRFLQPGDVVALTMRYGGKELGTLRQKVAA